MKYLSIIACVGILGGLLTVSDSSAAEHAQHGTKVAAKLKPYPLKTCLVSEEKLGGSMGEPFVYKFKDREIKFCCKSCQKDFDKDPAKYLKKLEAAENATKPPKSVDSGHDHAGHQH